MFLRAFPLPLLLLAACGAPANETVMTADSETAVSNTPMGPSIVEDPRADEHGELGKCDFSAYYAAPKGERRGTNVHAGPSAASRVVGKLPPPVLDPDREDEVSADFRVVEARDGWFRIDDVSPTAGDTAPESGWIEGRYIGFDLQTDKAFAEPTRGSPVVAISWEDPKEGIVRFGFRNASQCKGKWVKLRVTGRDGRERDGWASGVCGNQDTSCDGVVGEWIRPRGN